MRQRLYIWKVYEYQLEKYLWSLFIDVVYLVQSIGSAFGCWSARTCCFLRLNVVNNVFKYSSRLNRSRYTLSTIFEQKAKIKSFQFHINNFHLEIIVRHVRISVSLRLSTYIVWSLDQKVFFSTWESFQKTKSSISFGLRQLQVETKFVTWFVMSKLGIFHGSLKQAIA